MDASLQGLMDLAGVNAAMVFDGQGRLAAQRGRAVYDHGLCEQVAGILARAVDSIQLQQDDWESATAHFADGTIFLRSIRAVGGAIWVLAVVADATLNPAFAAVAIRVAANKVKKAVEGGGGASGGTSGSGVLTSSSVAPLQAGGSQPLPPSASQPLHPGASQPLPAHPAAGSRPVLSASGLSWSRAGGSAVIGVMAADPASAAYLTRCSKELARFVGPMAKVYVEEAVRRVCADQPFAMASAKPLREDLAGQVEDPKERAHFLKAAEAAAV